MKHVIRTHGPKQWGPGRATPQSKQNIFGKQHLENATLRGPCSAPSRNSMHRPGGIISFGALRVPIRPFWKIYIFANLWPGMPGQAGRVRKARPPVNQALGLDRNTLGFRPRWPPAFFCRKSAPFKMWTFRPGQIWSMFGRLFTKNDQTCSGPAFFVVTSAKAKNGPGPNRLN